jgi:hypothetical protein
MKKTLRDTEKDEAIKIQKEAVKLAAQMLGRLGGMAGKGEAKARPSEVCRAAVNKRWDAYRKDKTARRSARSD